MLCLWWGIVNLPIRAEFKEQLQQKLHGFQRQGNVCVPVCAHVCAPRNRGGGARAPLWNSCLFFPLMWWQGRCSHTQLLCFDKSMPHRQDFKGNFQAPSLPSPDEFELGRGEAGQNGGVEHQLWRHRCDNQHQDQHGTEEGRALCSPLPSRLGEGRCCAFVTGLPCVQVEVRLGATRIIPTTLGVCWVLAFWFRKQKPTVISVDLPYHLEPVNNVNKM